jgi:hypothetical protein
MSRAELRMGTWKARGGAADPTGSAWGSSPKASSGFAAISWGCTAIGPSCCPGSGAGAASGRAGGATGAMRACATRASGPCALPPTAPVATLSFSCDVVKMFRATQVHPHAPHRAAHTYLDPSSGSSPNAPRMSHGPALRNRTHHSPHKIVHDLQGSHCPLCIQHVEESDQTPGRERDAPALGVAIPVVGRHPAEYIMLSRISQDVFASQRAKKLWGCLPLCPFPATWSVCSASINVERPISSPEQIPPGRQGAFLVPSL